MFFWMVDVSQVYFEAEEVHACIVTCGGLCPGLNTVIREIVCGLYHMYGVKKVLGIDVSDYSILIQHISWSLFSHHSSAHFLVHDRKELYSNNWWIPI